MKNSLLVIFDEIWPMTLYYSTVSIVQCFTVGNKKLSLYVIMSTDFVCHKSTIASLPDNETEN